MPVAQPRPQHDWGREKKTLTALSTSTSLALLLESSVLPLESGLGLPEEGLREVGTGAAGGVHQADYTSEREGRRGLESEGHPRKTGQRTSAGGESFKMEALETFLHARHPQHMASSSRRPLTTYSRRRTRRRDVESTATQSSPIRALSPEREEVDFSVMANRMNKRARLVTRSINAADDTEKTGDKDAVAEGRPHKRQKPTSPDPDAPSDGDYMRDNRLPTASQIRTPPLAVPSDHSMVFSPARLAPAAQDQLSPLPVAKRILPRTSSRNFKENATQLSFQSLASPFSSRPGSRASSPGSNTRGVRKRSAHHSRALSQLDALQEKVVDRNVIQAAYLVGPQVPPTVTGVMNSATQGKQNVQAHHNRSSSTPTLKPALDHLSSRNWLVPAKAVLPHPTPTAHSDADAGGERGKTDTAVEHASFFIDAPMQISTPPRRRRSSTVGAWVHGLMPQLDADPPPPVRSFRYDSDVDMSDSSLPGSPLDSRPSRPDPPRRRRRTIVHLSSDSLFSSSLDFSALLSETKQYPRPAASEGSRSPELQFRIPESDLGPAFSLSSSPISSASRIRPNRMAPTGSLQSASCHDPSDSRRDFPGPPSSPSSGAPVQVCPDSEGDELLDLFSVLGLDEDQKWSGFHRADDSGVVLSSSSRSLEARTSTSAVAKNGEVRRKRGDTIRASDYTKLPAMVSSASFDSASTQHPASRRTRSGTVTQASSGGTRRKHDGWPTIKMRTNPEPLRADETGDDELLLKDGDVIE
ncbi:hypothetical protein LXA43DRAFT_1081394 [Ganoderma leucocontextum]|nr:hypothetical protein LXA43DRAFT_1081394 [Ganoderma leucocontextum]